MTKTEVSYALERGVMAKRKDAATGFIFWQLYDRYDTLPDARTEADRASPSWPKSYWRIVRSETVWLKEPES